MKRNKMAVTKIEMEMVNEAREYVANVESPLMAMLDLPLQLMLKEEIEQHFINGMKHVLDNPSGGALLYVNRKSYDIGYKDGWHKALENLK